MEKIIRLNDVTTFYALILGGMVVLFGAYLPDTQRVRENIYSIDYS